MSNDAEQVPYVFPYRVVLVYDDGREGLIDPAYLPLPIDPKDPNDGGAATLGLYGEQWTIDRVEEAKDVVPDPRDLDPDFRLATLFCSRAHPRSAAG